MAVILDLAAPRYQNFGRKFGQVHNLIANISGKNGVVKIYRVQESAAYATVSARQGRHLANTFEVAAIECLTWVAT